MTVRPLLAVDVPGAVHDALDAIVGVVGRFSVPDWLLVAAALALVMWGWVRARSFTRLGSIEIGDLAVDGAAFTPNAVKAALQQELAKRGWLPASGVPSGSPTAEAIGDAIAAAPIEQAKWIGSLVALIPTPPTSTSFKLSGTLYSAGGDQFALAYQLDCLGPLPSTKLHEVRRAGWPDVVDQASKDIYLAMEAAAPDMYPRWARWSNVEALSRYRIGLEIEQGRRKPSGPGPDALYAEMRSWFDQAGMADPENLLAPLRAATCLERAAGALESPEDALGPADLRIRALKAYTRIWRLEPTIFTAGFRVSVLLSLLADHCDDLPPEWQAELQGVVQDLDRKYDPSAPIVPSDDLRSACYERAQREAKHVRRLLWAWSIPLRYGRFRHRYEPSGRERRQLHKALGISKMCQRARQARALAQRARDARAAGDEPPAEVSDLTQFAWRAFVRIRYMAGRWYVAGWQAHYNAACFYALLPQASQPGTPFGDQRVRKRALAHLDYAVRQAGAELPRTWVQSDDPDLEVLRTYLQPAVDAVVDRLPRAL